MRRKSYTVCNWKAFLLYEFACVSWGHQIVCRSIHIVCNWQVFLLNVLACVTSCPQLVCRSSCIVCKWKVFLLNGSTCGPRDYQMLWRCICTVCKRKAFVCFEVFANFEGEIALNTGLKFVFSLYIHCHGCFINQRAKLGENWTFSKTKVELHLKSESGENIICQLFQCPRGKPFPFPIQKSTLQICFYIE